MRGGAESPRINKHPERAPAEFIQPVAPRCQGWRRTRMELKASWGRARAHGALSPISGIFGNGLLVQEPPRPSCSVAFRSPQNTPAGSAFGAVLVTSRLRGREKQRPCLYLRRVTGRSFSLLLLGLGFFRAPAASPFVGLEAQQSAAVSGWHGSPRRPRRCLPIRPPLSHTPGE